MADGMTTTVAGVQLRHEKDTWIGTIAGEKWSFAEMDHHSSVTRRPWQGFTWDHLTGTPVFPTLGKAVRWVLAHQAEIAAKLAARRAQGTRMVDPATLAKS